MSRQPSPTAHLDHHLSPSSASSSSSTSSLLAPTQRRWSTATNDYLLSPTSTNADDKWRHRQQPTRHRPTQLGPPGSTEQLLHPLLLQLSADDAEVRDGAHDLLVALVDQHAADDHQLEQLLEAIIASGLNEWATVDSAVCFNTMRVLPTLLQRILVRCGRNVSPKVMGRLVESLAKRLLQVTHQKQALRALARVKRVIGASLFDHFLETHYPRVKRDFDLLSDVYGESSDPNDGSSDEGPDEGVITKVYDEHGNEIAGTPSRRVTFGGEVVKIRTPDSDATTSTPTSGAEAASEPPPPPRRGAAPNGSRIPLPVRPTLHEPRRRHSRPGRRHADRLWSSSDDVHLDVDVDVNVLLRNIGLDHFDYLLNERDSSTTSSSEGCRHGGHEAGRKFGAADRRRVLDDAFEEEDWNERVADQDESDHIPAKSERTKRTVSSDFSLYPPEKPDISFMRRPVSEDTLNVLPAPSRLPVRLKSKANRLSMCHNDVTASLPSLRDVNGRSKKRYSNYLQQPRQQSFRTSQKNYDREMNQTHIPRSDGNNDNKLQKTTNSHDPPNDDGILDTSSSENTGDTVDKTEISNEDENEQLIIPSKLDSMLAERKPQQMKMEYSTVNSNLERKPGVKLKRSLTKEIHIPRSSYNANSQDLGPFEHPRDAMQRILLQFSSNEWELIIQALQGVIRLSKHHSKLLSPCLQPYAIAVSKEIKNLRSQVARAACSCAESIFRNVKNIVDQNIEELSNALFLRCTDTNKFLREDSNKALDAMIDNIKFSKSLSILTHKGANHVSALVRASTARLLLRLLSLIGASKILALQKEKRELIFSTVIKLSSDGNMETRSHAKNIILFFADNGRVFNSFCETLPRSTIVSINKFLSTAKKK